MAKVKICIDAGHGGKDAGAVLNKRYEKDDALKLAKRLGYVLQANGFNIAYTRATDVYHSPSEKASKGNASGADYFISIHRNSCATPNSATGVECLVYANTGIKKTLATNICTNLSSRAGWKNRGTKVRTDLAVLRGTKMPAVLVEVGFINNTSDNKIFDGDKFYTTVNAIAKGVCDSLGTKFYTITQLKAMGKIN